MYLFRGGHDQLTQLSPEESQAHMQKWGAWMGELSEKGILVDGLPLGRDGKRIEGSSKVVSDGPYAEGKEIVGGYLIVNAENMDSAMEISMDCPLFENDGDLEIREIMSMDM